ncbi:MAG: nickel ABC transporter, nickel/metallophore periplasmic binding protein [Desulfatitalea sp.]|nr:nickel ABC transporter substrate-binding protein [Desulfatitalea sp.]NNK02855.1 nickel ABC transporter, nickel/metallophore periplasmic binding protein [Desulfatitalea sp.]
MRIWVLAVVLVSAAAAVPAAGPQTLVYSWSGNVGPLNPHLYSPNQMFAQAMVYEPLVRYTAEGGIAPWLAAAWEISADRRIYTFHLRHEVSFSDGTPFTAQAAKKNFDTVIANGRSHSWLALVAVIAEVRVIDDHTLQLILKQPYYPVLEDLALVRPFRFLSPAAFPPGGQTADGIRAPIGTGPWRLAESRLGEYDLFLRNERYWGFRPKIERIRVKVISDPNTCAVAFQAGEIDLIYGDDQISPFTYMLFRGDRRYSSGTSPPLATRALALNSAHGPTREIAVRRAIQHAVDKEALVKGVLLDTETRADTLLSPTRPYCNLGLTPRGHDPALAERLLDDAGWRRTDDERFRSKAGRPLSLDLCFIGKSALQKSIAEVVQADLQQVGIRVLLKGVEEDMFGKYQKEGAFHMIFNDTWGPPYEPHAYCSSMRVPSHADYQAQAGLPMKADIDAWIARVLVSTDENERRRLYREILSTLHDQAVYLPISYTTGLMVHGPDLAGVAYGPTRYEIAFEAMVKKQAATGLSPATEGHHAQLHP